MLRRSAARFNPRILVTGANGQVGSELVLALRAKYGNDNVLASDVRIPAEAPTGPFEFCNVLEKAQVERLVVNHRANWIIHLSAIMSVAGENNPDLCLDLNVTGMRNVLDLARKHQLRCFIPSTMAVFSEASGKTMTKDDTILSPPFVYGITKVFAEQLGAYYAEKFGVDFRCLRYPGIISAKTVPGGGTTDYAVWMYHKAIEGKPYACPVLAHEPLPMMYIPDCLTGTVNYLAAERSQLKRNVYNVAGLSFSPDVLLKSIQRHYPKFNITYEPTVAQKIAHSWPDSMDDSNARNDWGFRNEWNLDAMTDDMIKQVKELKANGLL